MQAHERLEEVKLQAVQSDNVQLVQDILESLKSLQGKDEAVAELARILQEPHFKVRLRRVERKPGRVLELGFKHSAASFFKAQTPQKYRSRSPPPRHALLFLPSDELRPGVGGWDVFPLANSGLLSCVGSSVSPCVVCEFFTVAVRTAAAAAATVRNRLMSDFQF